MMESLQELLDRSAARHHHLCPRQVLGVRMGMLAGKALHMDLPQTDKRLFAFVECDGCGTGGIAVATGCWVDRRTMRVMDYGKLAATFVDTRNGRALRISSLPESRERAGLYDPGSSDRWHCQLYAYQVMLDEELFTIQPVHLTVSLEEIISRPGLLATCERCGEEIGNEREVLRNGHTLCRSCAGDGYYTALPDTLGSPLDYLVTSPVGNRLQGNGIRPVPLITLIGKSGAGKTTLLERLVKELSGRGCRLATIKHHSHNGFEIDVPGKDSWRFAQAGSEHVIIAAPDKVASYRKLDCELSLDEIASEVSGVDLILVEGYRQANKPTIEVVRAANSQELIGNKEQRIAIASDVRLDVDVPQFDLDDIQGIAGFIEERFLQGKREYRPAIKHR